MKNEIQRNLHIDAKMKHRHWFFIAYIFSELFASCSHATYKSTSTNWRDSKCLKKLTTHQENSKQINIRFTVSNRQNTCLKQVFLHHTSQCQHSQYKSKVKNFSIITEKFISAQVEKHLLSDKQVKNVKII